jgi:PadR family transcriptional regulator PadR
MSPRPMGYATLAVLRAVADGHPYGFDVIDHTGLPSGTVYPALSTLAGRGLVDADWEDERLAHSDGRPRRKYYEITSDGVAVLREGMERLGAMGLRVTPETTA